MSDEQAWATIGHPAFVEKAAGRSDRYWWFVPNGEATGFGWARTLEEAQQAATQHLGITAPLTWVAVRRAKGVDDDTV